jgi:hypothetical protein
MGDRKAVVGSILVRPEFDISGRINLSFDNANKQPVLLGSDVNTESTFPAGLAHSGVVNIEQARLWQPFTLSEAL